MKRSLLIVMSFMLMGCVEKPWSNSALGGRKDQKADSQKLSKLLEDYFEEYLRLFPVFATSVGDHRYDDRLGNAVSEEHRRQQQALYTKYLTEISKLDRGAIERQDRLNFDLLHRQLTLPLEGLAFPSHFIPLRQLASTPVEFPLLGSGLGMHPFKTVRDYDNFLQRIEGFQVWVDTAIANMRRGMELGIVQPRVVIERTLPQLEAMIVSEVRQSIFYQPILQMPAGFGEEERIRLTQAYTQAVERQIVPTYRRLHAFIRDEYLPQCRTSVALSELPRGREWYAHLVKIHTTTDLAPDQVFEIGLSEVARIHKDIERLKEEVGFNGKPGEFATYLSRNTPAYRNKDDLIKAYEELRGKVARALPKLFGRVPKASYEIRPIEEFRERSAPSQYWAASPDGSRPGIFYVNAGAVRERPVRISEALFLHEAVPGHHFQISLQREEEALPKFRRFGHYTAFSEGWALYAESLGRELGLYTDPYQYFLRLNLELFRAVRLVVDGGLHHKGWTREEALKFMLDNMLTSESGAMMEIDRYIARPGQALAYKIGQLKISAMRAKAEKALGPRFDIRAFHDELLKGGALPLDLLETKMDAWISRQTR